MALVAGGVSAGQLSAGNAPAQFVGMLPANVRLLQPGSGYFRLTDALQTLNTGPALDALQGGVAGIPALQAAVTAMQGTVASLQASINTLNGQIATINARLAAAGIP
jgi:hypothetical protein